jgi:hypothetical protein
VDSPGLQGTFGILVAVLREAQIDFAVIGALARWRARFP